MVTGLRSSRSGEILVPVSRPSLPGLLLVNVARVIGRLVVWSCRHPVAVLVLALAAVVLRSHGPRGLAIVAAAVGALLVVWWRVHPVTFRRVVVSPFRAAFVYARMWQPAMVTCGLDTRMGGEEYLPRIRRVVSTPYVDRVLVKILPGQSPEQYENATSQLAHTFSSVRCRVVLDRPGRLWLEFTHGDSLAEIVPAITPPASVDLTALPIGRTEGGGDWRLRLLGSHLLVAGATGSGKGSVMASMLRAMGPGIRDGSVEVWAIDPKGGMELTPSSGLFERFVYDSPASMVQLLEEAVSFMRFRAERLRLEGQRVHVPSPGDPLVVVLVDEMAALTAYVGDRDLKRRAESALQLLLSQGRAPGVLVVAAVQDPGKDVVGFRDLFPSRIALRLLEDVQVDMVLGRSARLRGAECDQIPASLPGVGYVVLEGVREPVRVRAAYMSDDDVKDTVARFSRDRYSDVVQLAQPAEGRG
ncbi:FtsK/SpoIIIE domain-containing protein [Intrasporangium sp. DVR]|uniref:FtsK/SpoIIIE domain-containing protein n=1 Tax=Intrasporangium sp. DVR TaxID=3127867 RepID=UPI00333F397C